MSSSSSAPSTSYRDRTSEFRSLSESLKKIHGIPDSRSRLHKGGEAAATDGSDGDDGGGGSANSSQPERSSSSEFNNRTSRIGQRIHETAQKIASLSVLAKKSTIFDDPILEIQELTALIKNEISSLNAALSELQFFQNSEVADGIQSKDVAVHATAICDDLKSKLMGTTKQFKDVLTSRTESLKAHEKRKQFFSTNASREDLFAHRQKKDNEPPPWASSAMSSDGVQIANQLRRRPAAESAPAEQMEVSMLQQLAPREGTYMQSRATSLQSVESTISELGGIFTQLATMVSQQGELAIRIDDNMDESLANVENARGALVKHLSRISSNRWLLIKIFLVLVVFLMVFVFFVV